MYDRALTDRRIAEVSARQGWALEPHGVIEVDRAISHFDDLLDAETLQMRRPLTPDEVRWIQNERKMCALDFDYWCSRYAWIIDWAKKEVRFRPNIAQKMLIDIWADSEAQGHAIMMMSLKARQLGNSTLAELAVGHRVQFCPRTCAVVASADPKKTMQMGGMIKFCWDKQPWWLMPTPTRHEKNMPVEFGDINTSILIQAGNMFHGVARGQTPNVAHLSEVSSWLNAEEDIDASMMHAIHPTPDVFVVLESTALGRDNWWHDTWQYVKTEYPRGRSQLRPVFLPWYVGTDIWPTKDDLKQRPVPADWTPSDRTVNHADRAREYVLANPLLSKHLAKGRRDWTLPREQMWFYEIEYEKAKAKGTLNKWRSEMPASDLEAFQNTNISVIDQDTMLNYRERVKPPVGVYTIIGPGIPQALIAPRHQWDPDQPAITVRAKTVVRSDEVFQFIPLKFDGYAAYDPMLKLFIWEWPEDGQTYGVGVDTSDGIGQDRSVIEVLRKASDDRGHAQVAEFASDYIKANQLWPMALAISVFFSTYSPRVGRRAQSRVAVECRGNGEVVQSEMQKRGWVNFHPWKKYDNKRPMNDSKVRKIGVFTNMWFRSMMMDTLLSVVDEGWLEIGSPWLVDELETLERDMDAQSARAAYNAHDDRVMGLGFILFSLTIDDRPNERQMRSRPQYLADALDEGAPFEMHPVWQAPSQATSWPGRGVPMVPQHLKHLGRFDRYQNMNMPRRHR